MYSNIGGLQQVYFKLKGGIYVVLFLSLLPPPFHAQYFSSTL